MQGRATNITEVANEVLGLLGEDPVTDITVALPDTKAGIKLKVHLYTSIDEVQRSFYWQELTTPETIAADATDHYDGRKRYALPANCLRPIGVRFNDSEPLPETTYSKLMEKSDDFYGVEGNFLITSAESVDILYIRREDNPTEWTSELQGCIVHAAAVNAGQSITGDPQIVSNVLQKYEQLVKPHAKRLQSIYKTNDRELPRGFSYWKARRL
jgi:hypothetical protein